MKNNKNLEIKTDSEGFYKIDDPFILIASSGDVAEEREIAERIVKDVLYELGKFEVIPYVWDVQYESKNLDQRRTMQQSIPRTSSENCLGVIYILGERIGFPMEKGFNHNIIEGVEKWLNAGEYRLEPDWPINLKEVQEKLDQGYFPLTGGVFEFLDAIGYRSDSSPEGKPVRLCLLADRPIKLDGEEIPLNYNRWFTEQTKNMNRTDRSLWEKNEYVPQSIAVHNFMRSIATKSINQNLIATHEELRRNIRNFVTGVIFHKKSRQENPYRNLEYYDINHGDLFYGRNDLVKKSVGKLIECFNKGVQRPVIRLSGPSGSGKSSVLRAGILRSLGDSIHRRRFHVAALRPEDFKKSNGKHKGVIITVLEAISKQSQLKIRQADIFEIMNHGANAPEKLAEVISNTLLQSSISDACLIIGLDQFEEIVDMLSGISKNIWNPLLKFVEKAIKLSNIGIVYTLENSRKLKHDELNLGNIFDSAIEVEVELTTSFFDDVILEPFNKTGYRLANDVLVELESNLNKIRENNDHVARNSVLPLLALKLYHLWDFISERFEADMARNIIQIDVRANNEDAISVSMLKEYGESLNFKYIIEKQAMKAWDKAGIGEINDDSLDYFLQPLLGIENERLQLVAAPRNFPYKDEKALVESFLYHRLIIGAGDGLIRLVHEAVIKHWDAAYGWYKRKRKFLVMKALLLEKSKVWESSGKPKITYSKKNVNEISNAVEILSTYIRHWALDYEATPNSSSILYEYCKEIFSLSKTPAAPSIREPEIKGNHVNLAASYGMLPLLKKFSKLDPNCLLKLSSPSKKGISPLHAAAWSQFDTVKLLLQKNADPFLLSGELWPPVVSAIQRNNYEIFLLLMNKALSKEPKNKLEKLLVCPDDRSLLHLAAQFDNYHATQDLLSHYGLSITKKDTRDWLPIYYATLSDSIQVFKLLYEFPEINYSLKEMSDCLFLAASNGAKSILDYMLKQPNQREILNCENMFSKPAIEGAVENYCTDCVRIILPHISLKDIKKDLLEILFNKQNVDKKSYDIDKLINTLNVLLEDSRIDINKVIGSKKHTPLGLAKHTPRAQRLLLENPNIDMSIPAFKGGSIGFFIALRLGVWSAVRLYIREHGLPKKMTTDDRGNTVLHLLTKQNAPSNLILKVLDQATRKQLNARNKQGQTPLIRALETSNWNVASKMIATNLINMGKVRNGFEGELYIALELGAPNELISNIVNSASGLFRKTDDFGWTFLHHLTANNYVHWLKVIIPLVKDPSDWLKADIYGRSPLDLASEALRSLVAIDVKLKDLPVGGAWDANAGWYDICSSDAQVFVDSTRELLKETEKELTLNDWSVKRGYVSFYPGKGIFKVQSLLWENQNRAFYFLENEGELLYLNGTSTPIHKYNKKCPIKLNPENVIDYLKFFGFFVRGEEGPFFIYDSINKKILDTEISSSDQKKIASLVHPAWLISESEEGYEAVSRVFHGNAIFNAYFSITLSGMVEMRSDFPIIAGLSGGINSPLS